jgi:hypothetical protein
LNPYLSCWFAGLSLAGMGLAAYVGDIGFRRLAVRYGAQDLGPPPGLLRALFRILLTLWMYLIGALLASLVWQIWPEVSSLPAGVSITLGFLGAFASTYYLMRGY